jgi:hypothetical protein
MQVSNPVYQQMICLVGTSDHFPEIKLATVEAGDPLFLELWSKMHEALKPCPQYIFMALYLDTVTTLFCKSLGNLSHVHCLPASRNKCVTGR